VPATIRIRSPFRSKLQPPGGALVYLFFLLLAGALIFQLLALISLARFFSQPLAPRPLPPNPGVTIFKPLKGLADNARECLASFLTQDYQPYQVLFGVADPQDPVLTLLHELQRDFPGPEVEIVFCQEKLGLNPKISTLRQLESRARHEILVLADGDVKVGADFLSVMVAALREPGVGVVSLPYRAGRARTLGAWLEALTISADFIPSVAVAYYAEGVRFALGATMALTRDTLKAIGGLAALADFLADDYQLGYRAVQAGFKVKLLPYVVETENPEISLPDYLGHQLRWARTYRVCRPKGYLAYGIAHALVYSLLLWLASGMAPYALGLVGATLAVRGTLTWFAERSCLKGELPWPAFMLLPLKDLLAFGLWLLSFLGNQVTWQGARYRVTPTGKLEPVL
jgi:ceramide glucosyltransferase